MTVTTNMNFFKIEIICLTKIKVSTKFHILRKSFVTVRVKVKVKFKVKVNSKVKIKIETKVMYAK